MWMAQVQSLCVLSLALRVRLRSGRKAFSAAWATVCRIAPEILTVLCHKCSDMPLLVRVLLQARARWHAARWRARRATTAPRPPPGRPAPGGASARVVGSLGV